MAEDQILVSQVLTQLANDLCQRCPGYANDMVTDAMTCVTNTTTNATYTARDLRFFTDDTLTRLDTCLLNASPPADGCIAFKSCYQNLFPNITNPCRDGGV